MGGEQGEAKAQMPDVDLTARTRNDSSFDLVPKDIKKLINGKLPLPSKKSPRHDDEPSIYSIDPTVFKTEIPRTFTLRTIEHCSPRELFNYIRYGQNANTTLHNGNPLIIETFELFKSSSIPSKKSILLEKFYILLGFVDLQKIYKDKDTLFDLLAQIPNYLELLIHAEKYLNFLLNNKREELLKKIKEVCEEIELGLVKKEIQKELDDDIKEIGIKGDSDQEKENVANIFALCACRIKENLKRKFKKEELCYQILGIQGIIPATDILAAINKLFSSFDHHQKLTAIFMVKEILFYDVNNELIKSNLFEEKLTIFLNILSDSDLGSDFPNLIKKLVKLKKRNLGDRLAINHSIIKNHIKNLPKPSFDELVENALALDPSERYSLVRKITDEIRLFSYAFHRDASLRELDNESWIKEYKKEKSPHIVSLTAYTNKFINYIAHKILTRPTIADIVKALQLFIEIGYQLSLQTENYGPDLNMIICISGALNHIAVSRLKEIFDLLDTNYVEVYKCINVMTLSIRNYKNLIHVANAFPDSIPFLSCILHNIVASTENSEFLDKISLAGHEYALMLATQQLVIQKSICFKTDLPEFLLNIPEVPNERLAEISETIAPPILNFDSQQEPQDVINYLKENKYLIRKCLPVYSYKGKVHPKEKFLEILQQWFIEKLTITFSNPKKSNKDDEPLKELDVIHNDFTRLLSLIMEIDKEFQKTIFGGEYLEPIQTLRRQLLSNSSELKRNSPILEPINPRSVSSDSLGGGEFFLPKRKSFTFREQKNPHPSSSSFPSGLTKKK